MMSTYSTNRPHGVMNSARAEATLDDLKSAAGS